jgi:phosphoenolpyruvate synthase/pyruvate phosphate dikinase
VSERRWLSTHRAVLPEERNSIANFEEATFTAPVQKLIFSNEDGTIYSGATGVGVSQSLKKMILAGAYEQGTLVCNI